MWVPRRGFGCLGQLVVGGQGLQRFQFRRHRRAGPGCDFAQGDFALGVGGIHQGQFRLGGVVFGFVIVEQCLGEPLAEPREQRLGAHAQLAREAQVLGRPLAVDGAFCRLHQAIVQRVQKRLVFRLKPFEKGCPDSVYDAGGDPVHRFLRERPRRSRRGGIAHRAEHDHAARSRSSVGLGFAV